MARSVEEIVRALFKVPYPWVVDISKDGRWALFTSDEPGVYQLFSVRADTGEVFQLTHGEDHVLLGSISNSCRRVAFARDVKGNEQHRIYEIPIEGGKEEPIFEEEGYRIFYFEWAPDDESIAFTASTAETNGLWLLGPGEGKKEPLFRSRGWCFGPSWSPDGSWLGVNADTTGVPKSMELVFVPLGGNPVVYTPKQGSLNENLEWSPDGRRVLFKTDARGRYELAVLDRELLTISYLKRAPEHGLDFPFFDWSKDGSSVFYVAMARGRTSMYEEDLEGGLSEVKLPKGVCGSMAFSDRDVVAFSWSSLERPTALAFMDLRTGAFNEFYDTARFLPEWIKDRLGRPGEFSYRSFDGVDIHGFMLKPTQGLPPHPCVVAAHGGPWANYDDSWRPGWHALAACGYVVVGPNFRGSTGYGPEFQFMNLGDPGGGDLLDVVECRKWISGLPFVDASRVAVMGGSYGGFMTNIAMVKYPGLWAAGVSIASVSDWVEDYELADAAFKAFDEWLFKGRPDERGDLYRDRSPIHFADRLAAPLLLIHPTNDTRCPLRPVERFYKKLVEAGKDVKLVTYEEGHGAAKVENEIRTFVEAIKFLNEKLSHSAT